MSYFLVLVPGRRPLLIFVLVKRSNANNMRVPHEAGGNGSCFYYYYYVISRRSRQICGLPSLTIHGKWKQQARLLMPFVITFWWMRRTETRTVQMLSGYYVWIEYRTRIHEYNIDLHQKEGTRFAFFTLRAVSGAVMKYGIFLCSVRIVGGDFFFFLS